MAGDVWLHAEVPHASRECLGRLRVAVNDEHALGLAVFDACAAEVAEPRFQLVLIGVGTETGDGPDAEAAQAAASPVMQIGRATIQRRPASEPGEPRRTSLPASGTKWTEEVEDTMGRGRR